MAGRRCPAPRCPRVITGTQRYCTEHARDYEARRGTPAQRGYDAAHVRLRKTWQARMARGEAVHCARCGLPVDPTQPWALDHTDDRRGYLGPSHASCNNSAGGQAAHQ